MKKTITGTLIIMLSLVLVLLFYSFEKEDSRFKNSAAGYDIVQKWELPEELNEVSAIEWIGDQKVAAVQDEDGIIFIYDLDSGKIEKEISFGSGGDYEGLSISEGTAYVLRSDGTVFEIKNYMGQDPEVSPLKTNLSEIKDIDVEGLSLDKANNRLLLAVKEDKQDKKARGVYTYDLKQRKSNGQPVFRIKLSNPVLKGKAKGKFNPSEIEIHPKTGDYYILDAKNLSLVIAGKDGQPKSVQPLDKSDFSQPEGLTFTPDGTLYISNEAGDGPANILQISLN